MLTARPVTLWQIRGGAIIWQVLQWMGTHALGRAVVGAAASYGLFGVVLGLLTWIYSALHRDALRRSQRGARRAVWTRNLLTPFTDNVRLITADRRVYASYAVTERHKGFENINVGFDQRPDTTPPPKRSGAGGDRPGDSGRDGTTRPAPSRDSGAGDRFC